MYYDYFGLTEAPFSISPNPEYLFMTERHQEALAHLSHSIESDAGFVLLTGDVGTGKTTVCRSFLENLPENTNAAFILNPFLNGKELLRVICQELNIENVPEMATLRESTEAIYRHLLRNHALGKHTVLLIDEAQHLHFKVLELIRLLTNLETDTQKLLKIILVGQPELNDTLEKPELTQLSQRVTARYHINPLSLEETASYIDYRLRMAGYLSEKKLFPKSIVKKLFSVTNGIPRLINVICDRALLGTYSQNKVAVDRKILDKAIVEVRGQHYQLRKRNVQMWWYGIGAVASLVLLTVFIFQVVVNRESSVNHTSVVSESEEVPQSIQLAEENRVEHTVDNTNESSTPVSNPPGYAVGLNQISGTIQTVERSVPLPNNYYASQNMALSKLISSIKKDTLFAVQSCETIVKSGWQCRRVETESWQKLREYNRPAVVTLKNVTNNTPHYLVVTGINSTHAKVVNGVGSSLVPLAELEQYWAGEFVYLWQPPEGFSNHIFFDSDEKAVAWLANVFAVLDNREETLATKKFNSLLKKRVILFQRENSLTEDGIVGVETLLKLNEQLGVAVTLSKNSVFSVQ